jgi:putative peptide zinc metalloprotease protein
MRRAQASERFGPMNYIFNDKIVVRSLKSSSRQQVVLCEVPAQSGSVLRYAVPASLVAFLKLLDGTKTVEELVWNDKRIHPDSQYSVESVNKLIQEFCLPKGIVYDPAGQPVTPESPARKSYLYFRMKLLPHSFVYPIARRLAIFFRKPVLFFMATLIVLAHVAIYFFVIPGQHLNINNLNGTPLLEVTLITILAAFLHEFGHASALALHQCERLQIGLGLYLRFPVLYTDVSEAWRLAPLQRALVDVGGLYFQNFTVIVLLALFYWHPSTTYLYAIILIDLSLSFSMNPFLRMDGYWLMADLFGIYNLREQSIAVLKYLPDKWRNKGSVKPQFLDMQRSSFIALLIYTISSFSFFTYLIIAITYQALFYLLPAYPHYWISFVVELRHHPSFSAVANLFQLAWKTAVLIGCVRFAWRSVKKVSLFAIRHISGLLSQTPHAKQPAALGE